MSRFRLNSENVRPCFDFARSSKRLMARSTAGSRNSRLSSNSSGVGLPILRLFIAVRALPIHHGGEPDRILIEFTFRSHGNVATSSLTVVDRRRTPVPSAQYAVGYKPVNTFM